MAGGTTGRWRHPGIADRSLISHRDGNDEVYRINDDSTGPLRFTMSEFFAESGPAWSPCQQR